MKQTKIIKTKRVPAKPAGTESVEDGYSCDKCKKHYERADEDDGGGICWTGEPVNPRARELAERIVAISRPEAAVCQALSGLAQIAAESDGPAALKILQLAHQTERIREECVALIAQCSLPALESAIAFYESPHWAGFHERLAAAGGAIIEKLGKEVGLR